MPIKNFGGLRLIVTDQMQVTDNSLILQSDLGIITQWEHSIPDIHNIDNLETSPILSVERIQHCSLRGHSDRSQFQSRKRRQDSAFFQGWVEA
jgi:hypothetical protein